MPSSEQKWRISMFSAVLFLLVVNPLTYKLTNQLLSGFIGPISINGCPTNNGIILHTIVFILLVRYSMDIDIV